MKITLIKAKSFFLRMILRQELPFKHRTLDPWPAGKQVPKNRSDLGSALAVLVESKNQAVRIACFIHRSLNLTPLLLTADHRLLLTASILGAVMRGRDIPSFVISWKTAWRTGSKFRRRLEVTVR